MLIEIKRSNYYSRVLNTIKFKLIIMHFLSSNQWRIKIKKKATIFWVFKFNSHVICCKA